MLLLAVSVLALVGRSVAVEAGCLRPLTTASGPRVINNGKFCAGDLIFEDNFNYLDLVKWQHEITLGGGGNGEFQWYVNDRNNSYTENGVLHIKPTLTSDKFDEAFLTSGTINLGSECTNSDNNGCERTGTPTNILNPVRSARLRTVDSFSFKYGRIEINAKLPAGDWLWPAIWMLPSTWEYGGWPMSGEIDIMESRGNRNLVVNDVPIGPEQVGSTLHFGPNPGANAWDTSHFERNTVAGQGFQLDFHRYQLEWTPDHLTFKVDDIELGTITVGDGFWSRGGFPENFPWSSNPWRNGEQDAPFDQEFHLLINLAIGGTNYYFPDVGWNPDAKPWLNTSPNASTEFWAGRDAWLRTWNYYVPENTESHFQIDYVRVWAL